MSLFDIVKKNTNVLVDSDDAYDVFNVQQRFDKRRNTFRGRASDNQGNTYMYEGDPTNGILDQRKISVSPDGDKLAQAKQLKKQGFTQDEIADMLGVSQSTVSNWLRK